MYKFILDKGRLLLFQSDLAKLMEMLENDTKTSEVLTSLLNNKDKREGGKKEEKESKTSLTSLKKERKTSCRKIVVDIKQKLLDRIQSKRFVDYNDARLTE